MDEGDGRVVVDRAEAIQRNWTGKCQDKTSEVERPIEGQRVNGHVAKVSIEKT